MLTTAPPPGRPHEERAAAPAPVGGAPAARSADAALDELAAERRVSAMSRRQLQSQLESTLQAATPTSGAVGAGASPAGTSVAVAGRANMYA